MKLFIFWLVFQIIFAAIYSFFVGKHISWLIVVTIPPLSALTGLFLIGKQQRQELLCLFHRPNLIIVGAVATISFLVNYMVDPNLVNMSDPAVRLFMSFHNLDRVIAIILFTLIGPLTEELVFRGALFNSYLKYGSTVCCVLVALLFAMVHAIPAAMVVLFMQGLLLCIIRLETRNLTNCLLVHGINNFICISGVLFLP